VQRQLVTFLRHDQGVTLFISAAFRLAPSGGNPLPPSAFDDFKAARTLPSVRPDIEARDRLNVSEYLADRRAPKGANHRPYAVFVAHLSDAENLRITRSISLTLARWFSA